MASRRRPPGIIALVVTGLSAVCVHGATITIRPDGTGDYLTIQQGIDAACDGDEVVLTPGCYTGPGNRDLDFSGKAITVRGSEPQTRSVAAATVIDCAASEADPHRGFTFDSGEGPDSIVAGLTITNGFAPVEAIWLNEWSVGGAVFCERTSPTIADSILVRNQARKAGGGIFCYDGSRPTVRDCLIAENHSFSGGAGMRIYWNSDPLVVNCVFSGNTAVEQGAGLCACYSSPTVVNSLFTGNTAGTFGGGLCNCFDNCSATLIHCTFSGNSAGTHGGAVHNYYSHPTMTGCVLWGNAAPLGPEIAIRGTTFPATLTVAYSDVRGGAAAAFVDTGCTLVWGEGNLDADPGFVAGAGPDGDAGTWQDNDYHLAGGSPCIDAGDPSFVPRFSTADIDGQPRVLYAAVDLGADEFALPPDFDTDGDVDQEDFGFFQAGLTDPSRMPDGPAIADFDGDGDADQDDFGIFQRCMSGPDLPADPDCAN